MRKVTVSLLIILVATAAFAGDGSIRRTGGKKIQDRYFVVLEKTVDRGRVPDIANEMAFAHAGRLLFVYQNALKGFAIELPEGRARALAHDPRVAWVEEDFVVQGDAVQTNAPWGLDRIDQRNRPLSGTYSYDFTGTGVHVYVIDSGIRSTHTEFGGRATKDVDFINGNGNDCNGHGTHVAGIIGGSTYGVAKNVRMHSLRVLDCNMEGPGDALVAAINWVTANRVLPAVANVSIRSAATSDTVDTAVNNSVNAGVFYAVAAGNFNQDACFHSPARAALAYTVGATTSTDSRWFLSNFGSCLEIFAPGENILSASYPSDTATEVRSGTSMAAPHVAGAAALLLQENSGLSPSDVAATLTSRATVNVLTGIGNGSPNKLLFTPPGTCRPPNAVCSVNSDCCSNMCWAKSIPPKCF